MCNKHIVNWSESEDSSHINLCLCALLFYKKMHFNVSRETLKKVIKIISREIICVKDIMFHVKHRSV